MKAGDRVIVRMQKSRKYGVLTKKRVTGWSVLMDGNAAATKDVREDRIERMPREHPAYNINWRTA
jgi:hypothetical protein